MKAAIKSIATAIICLSLLLQAGCWSQKLYEEIGFILQVGMENDPDGKLLFSVTSPVIAPDVQGKVEFLHTSSERLIRASRERIRSVSGKMLLGGKIQHVYFSKDLAAKGIADLLEIFLRNPENPLLANVVVVDGSPKEMMEFSIDYQDKPRPAFYLAELLRDAHRTSKAPETRIFKFSILNQSKTIDPVTPLIRYDKKNIKISGSALFNGDKMVGEIDTDQTLLLNALIGKKGGGEYIYKGEGLNENTEKIKQGAAMFIKSSKRKVRIETGGDVPVINIKLELTALLDEYSGAHNLDRTENEKELEERISSTLQAEVLKLLKYLQDVGSDPIGFGEMLRSKQNSYWKSVQWKVAYKDAIFNTEVKLDLESYGTIK